MLSLFTKNAETVILLNITLKAFSQKNFRRNNYQGSLKMKAKKHNYNRESMKAYFFNAKKQYQKIMTEPEATKAAANTLAMVRHTFRIN